MRPADIHPFRPFNNPFEVQIDETTSPITLHHPLNRVSQEQAFTPVSVPRSGMNSITSKDSADSHLKRRKSLFKELRRVCSRSGRRDLRDELATKLPDPPVIPTPPTPLRTPRSSLAVSLDHNYPFRHSGPPSPFVVSYDKDQPLSFLTRDEFRQFRKQYPEVKMPPPPALRSDPDYLPLTSVPTSIPQDPIPPPIRKSQPAQRWTRISPAAPSRTYPSVRFDIVPNPTPDSTALSSAVEPNHLPRHWPPSTPAHHLPSRAARPLPPHPINKVSELRQRSVSGPRPMPKYCNNRRQLLNKTNAIARFVAVTSAKPSYRTNPPVQSRSASIESTETFIIRDLAPILPDSGTSPVCCIRAIFEAILPPQGSTPGRRFTVIPRSTPPIIPATAAPSPVLTTSSSFKSSPTARLGGNMPPCPCCREKVACFDRDRITGPHGTVWHQSCLTCGGGEGRGRRKSAGEGCGKRLDRNAIKDSRGVISCRNCLVSLPHSGVPGNLCLSPFAEFLARTKTKIPFLDSILADSSISSSLCSV